MEMNHNKTIASDVHSSRIDLRSKKETDFAVTLAPYEEILVQYEHNSLTVTLQDSELAIWTDDQPISLTFHVPRGARDSFLAACRAGYAMTRRMPIIM